MKTKTKYHKLNHKKKLLTTNKKLLLLYTQFQFLKSPTPFLIKKTKSKQNKKFKKNFNNLKLTKNKKKY